MTVAELITELQKLPPDALVGAWEDVRGSEPRYLDRPITMIRYDRTWGNDLENETDAEYLASMKQIMEQVGADNERLQPRLCDMAVLMIV